MSTHLTAEDLDRIEKAAKRATPGTWEWLDEYTLCAMYPDLGRGAVLMNEDGVVLSSDNAVHIETADPSTVLALVAEVRRLRSLPEDPEAVERAALTDVCKTLTDHGLPSIESLEDVVPLLGPEGPPRLREQARAVLRAALNPDH